MTIQGPIATKVTQMSKSRGPHEAVKPLLPVLPSDPGKGSALLHTVVQILTALSLFFVVMAPIAYVNGRAYHDGWYDALHLDQAMFPLDAQGTTTQAMVAWEVAFSAMFSGTAKAFAAHWLPVFVGLAADFVMIVGFAWLIERWDDQRKKQMGVAAKKEKSPMRRALDRALQPILVRGHHFHGHRLFDDGDRWIDPPVLKSWRRRSQA